jgi:hypothetical protein
MKVPVPHGLRMCTISFVIALCLTFFGAFALVYLLLFADGWRGWMVTGAGLVLAVGAVWLYSDQYLDATPKQQ